MEKKTVFVEMDDGKKVALHTWIPDGDIKGVVQLSHGMAEYAMRYDAFGDMLNENGYVFYAHDHRGHGETASSPDELGFLAEQDGFHRVVKDLHAMIQKVHQDFPGKKVFLFGHSFGSFVSQCYLQNYGSEIDGCILCGSAGPRKMLTGSGKLVTDVVKLFKGKKYRSKFIDNLAFGTYNSHFKDSTSNFAWLSRDPAEIKKYEDSDLCGFLCTLEFFSDFFGGLTEIAGKKNIAKVPKNLPVYLIAGHEDPVGDYGKSVQDLYDAYKTAGIKDLDMKLYPGARHEILNETNREEVYKDVSDWIASRNK